MKWKFSALLLALVMVTSLFIGCSSDKSGMQQDNTKAVSSDNAQVKTTSTANGNYLETGKITDKNVTLKWLHRFPEDNYEPYFKSLADGYSKEHPNVKIDIEAVGDQPIKDKLRVMVGGGDIPDIFYSWAGEFAGKFARANLAVDITPYTNADKEWKDSIPDSFWNTASMYNIIAGVPFRYNAGFLNYNKSIFKKYNLEAPKTWSELLEVCKVLKSNGIIPIAYGNSAPWYSAWWFTALFRQTVPEDVRTSDYNPKTGKWTDPGYKQAIEMMQELQRNGYLNDNVNSMTFDQVRELFLVNKAGIVFNSLMSFDKVDNKLGSENWDWMPFPAIDGAKGTTGTVVGSADLFIVSKTSKNPDVAIDFLKYITKLDNQKRMIKETGLSPTAKGAMTQETTNPKILKALDYLSNDSKGLSEYFDTATEARVCDKWLENFQLLFQGKKADDILSEVQSVAKNVSGELSK